MRMPAGRLSLRTAGKKKWFQVTLRFSSLTCLHAGLERGIQNWLFFLDQTPARGAFSRQPSPSGQGCTCLGLNETGYWKRPFIRPQRRPYC